MKLVQIVNSQVYVVETRWPTAEEARKHFAPSIVFEDAPDWVGIGFTFVPSGTTDEERWLKPGLPDGWVWDENGNPWEAGVSRQNEARDLRERAEADLFEVLKAIRRGDTSEDWEARASAIEAYLDALDAVPSQEGYPIEVEWPEYPIRDA